jgi:hypothetical protein
MCLQYKLFQAITFIMQRAVFGESHTTLLAEMPMRTQRFVELRHLFRQSDGFCEWTHFGCPGSYMQPEILEVSHSLIS